jgi:hypothetical protein
VALWQAENMARGWESKAVESQIEEAETRAARRKPIEVDPEQHERESIQLSRTRVLQDLASASNPKYREYLQRSLEYLDEKLSKLGANKSDRRA